MAHITTFNEHLSIVFKMKGSRNGMNERREFHCFLKQVSKQRLEALNVSVCDDRSQCTLNQMY